MPGSNGSRTARRLLAVSATIVSAVALTFAGASAASADDHTSFPGSKPTWATAKNQVGTPPVDEYLDGQIQLRLKDEAGAEALAAAVSTPGSPLYRHYITPAAWIARFSPSVQDYAKVVAYVKSFGLTISATPKDRLFVNYRGTTAQMNSAFAAKMRTFHADGTTIAAPSVAPTLPTAVAAVTSAVDLAQIRHVATPSTLTSKVSVKTTKTESPVLFDVPCSAYWTQHSVVLPAIDGLTRLNTNNCGYTGAQMRSAYGATGDGAGQTIGEVLWGGDSTLQQDANRLFKDTGTAPLTTLRQIPAPGHYDAALCDADTDIEAALDIEAMHGLAPKANIVYANASDCDYGVDAALSELLDDHLSSVVSNSYSDLGELPADQVQAELHQQWLAAAEGVGLYYSSGDDGDETDNGVAATPNYQATSPWVTAVGGTTTEIGKDGRIAEQTGWGNSYTQLVKKNGVLTYDPLPGYYDGGAGGGVSAVFKEPWYQQGVIPSSIAHGMRAEPDVSADADPQSGLLIGLTLDGQYIEAQVGGTSLASPVVATEAVLAQQRTGCTFGFVNPTIYRTRSVVTDVQAKKIDVAEGNSTVGVYVELGSDYTSLSVTPGWDSVTGLGSLSVPAFASAFRR